MAAHAGQWVRFVSTNISLLFEHLFRFLKGSITLWDAAADGNLEAMKVLLSLDLASTLILVASIVLLIQSRLGASWTKVDAKDSNGNTALVEAARWGHDECVSFLIEKGADVASKNQKGQTALHIAAQQGRDSTCKLLVGKSAGLSSLSSLSPSPTNCAQQMSTPKMKMARRR